MKCEAVEGYGVVKEERGPGFKFGIMIPCSMKGWDPNKLLQTSVHVLTDERRKVESLREMFLSHDIEMLGRSDYGDGDKIAIKHGSTVLFEYDTLDLRGASGTQIDYLLSQFQEADRKIALMQVKDKLESLRSGPPSPDRSRGSEP